MFLMLLSVYESEGCGASAVFTDFFTATAVLAGEKIFTVHFGAQCKDDVYDQRRHEMHLTLLLPK